MNIIKRLLLLAPLALAGLDHAPAHAANTARQEHVQGSVAYISGGVSSDEADAMKAAAANYPLTLELAVAGEIRDTIRRQDMIEKSQVSRDWRRQERV